MCYNHKTKYTDECPIPKDGRWGICLRMQKPVKEVALTILDNGRANITQSIIAHVFFLWTQTTVLMLSQCSKFYSFDFAMQS